MSVVLRPLLLILSLCWISEVWSSHPDTHYEYSNQCPGNKQKSCRPPQFVIMAFDGGKSIDMWEKTRKFAENQNIQFTYFVSGAYLLVNKSFAETESPGDLLGLDPIFSHKNYLAEQQRNSTQPVAGKSNVGFDQSLRRVKRRYAQMIKAHLGGHEIASHGIGHFASGSKTRWNTASLDWSTSQWNSEFRQFSQMLMNGFDYLPELLDDVDTQLSQWQLGHEIGSSVGGFRAPLLSSNKDLCGALVEWGFQYDTSTYHPRHRWPKRLGHCSSVWNFGLPTIAVPNQKNEILAMDYNLEQRSVSVNDAVQAYQDYFHRNYNGNRAPLHIGHHFAPYGGRIAGDPKYWYVLKKFAKSVCSLPEVMCTSYRNLERFISSTPETELARFDRGDFSPLIESK